MSSQSDNKWSVSNWEKRTDVDTPEYWDEMAVKEAASTFVKMGEDAKSGGVKVEVQEEKE